MKILTNSIELGATLYIPATHSELWQVTQGYKFPYLKSLALCLEDAVLEQDIPRALLNLKQLLIRRLEQPTDVRPALFIRPRHVEMAKQILDWNLSASFDGFILPKFNLQSMDSWIKILPNHLHYLPTLESKEYFDFGHNQELLQALQHDFPKVLCLRIGGNDLLSCLNLRRPKDLTIYETPIGPLMAQLCGLFVSSGFDMSAPVCEHIENHALLCTELQQDLRYGLFTKTAIHPKQVEIIQNHYRVNSCDLHDAQAILAPDAASVFKSFGSMLEPTTHRRWAQRIVLRHQHFGLNPDLGNISIA